MKRITVNGEPFAMEPMGDERPAPGAVIGQRWGRRVYRVLCYDGDEAIARNVRNRDLLVALGSREVAKEFGLVIPLRS